MKSASFIFMLFLILALLVAVLMDKAEKHNGNFIQLEIGFYK